MNKIILISDHYVTKLGLFLMLVSAVIFLSAQSAETAQTTANLQVTATVAASCTVSVGGDLAFGNYDPVNGNLGSVAVTVTCTNGQLYDIYVPEPRSMTSGVHTIAYELYRDNLCEAQLGYNVNSGWEWTGTGAVQNITIFGCIESGLNPSVGNYSQTVTLTVVY